MDQWLGGPEYILDQLESLEEMRANIKEQNREYCNDVRGHAVQTLREVLLAANTDRACTPMWLRSMVARERPTALRSSAGAGDGRANGIWRPSGDYRNCTSGGSVLGAPPPICSDAFLNSNARRSIRLHQIDLR